MPHILKIRTGSDSQIFVSSVTLKVPEPYECIADQTTFVVNNKDLNLAANSKLNIVRNMREVAGGSSRVLTPELNVEDHPEKVQQQSSCKGSIKGAVSGTSSLTAWPETYVSEPSNEVQHLSPPGKKNVGAGGQVSESHLPLQAEQISEPEVGFFKKMWRKLLGNEDCGSENKSHRVPEQIIIQVIRLPQKTRHTNKNSDTFEKKKADDKCGTENVGSSIPEKRTALQNLSVKKYRKTPLDTVEKAKPVDQLVKSTTQKADPVVQASYCSPCNEYSVDEKASGCAEMYHDILQLVLISFVG
ncbi:Endonuclease or glycosyl hydrolase, putative isoform 2 [Quillaja saponaria]|uniref:Endonuclease or glycosyl hydrolase, putative isoform 2 n=1 Tax=Quillaja saponaria TaxID=32244 RepID=A0AAD7KT38_QUISA|nr:Endonuclease or glycosyl hydrolase, putative isoform 2 [Quillaja saponaria]